MSNKKWTTAEVFDAVARREMTPDQGASLLLEQQKSPARELAEWIGMSVWTLALFVGGAFLIWGP